MSKISTREETVEEHMHLLLNDIQNELLRLQKKNVKLSNELKSYYPNDFGQTQTTIHESLDKLCDTDDPQSLLDLEDYLNSLKTQICKSDPKNLYQILDDPKEHHEILMRMWMKRRENESIFTSIGRAFFGAKPPATYEGIVALEKGWYFKLPKSLAVRQKINLNAKITNIARLGTPLLNDNKTKKKQFTLDELQSYLNGVYTEIYKHESKRKSNDFGDEDDEKKRGGETKKQFRGPGTIDISALWECLDKIDDQPNKVTWQTFLDQGFHSKPRTMEKRIVDSMDIDNIKKESITRFRVNNEYEIENFLDSKYIDPNEEMRKIEHINVLKKFDPKSFGSTTVDIISPLEECFIESCKLLMKHHDAAIKVINESDNNEEMKSNPLAIHKVISNYNDIYMKFQKVHEKYATHTFIKSNYNYAKNDPSTLKSTLDTAQKDYENSIINMTKTIRGKKKNEVEMEKCVISLIPLVYPVYSSLYPFLLFPFHF
jgi:hypothetical protein